MQLRPIVQMSGDWDEFRTEAGIAVRRVTGLTAQMQKRIIRWLYCVPACIGRIKDAAAKYYVALRLSLPRKVGMVIAANPSTLINLARAGDQEKESLIRDLARRHAQPASTSRRHPRRTDGAATPPIPSGPASWRQIVGRTGTLYPRDYWARTSCSSATGRAAASARTCGTSRAISATRRCATSA